MDPSRAQIIEVAALIWKDGQIVERFESLIHPHTPVPREIIMLTGITDEMVVAAPNFSDIKGKLLSFFGDLPIVGHNVAFDTAFLKSHHLELKNPEIDTVSLARILLRKEASYALEVLMKTYELPIRNSHRAMADVETTVSFFEFLLEKIGELPAEVLEAMRRLLETSSWGGKLVFEERAEGRGLRAEGLGNATPVPQSSTVQRPAWPEHITEKFLSDANMLLETSAAPPLDQLRGEKLIIAWANPRTRQRVFQQAAALNIPVGELKDPHFYLHPKKLEEKLLSPQLAPEEMPFLLKMIAWRHETKTGDREEIALEREEYGQFDALADNEGNGAYFQKSLEEAKKHSIILLHHHGLAHHLHEKVLPRDAEEEKSWRLIILDASRLEDSFTNALKKRYTESALRLFFGEKAAMIFGFLGIFHDHFSPEDEYSFRGNTILGSENRESQEFKRVLSAIENLPPSSKKDEFAAALSSRPNTLSWVSAFFNEVSFTSTEIALTEIFRNRVAPFKNTLLQSPALSADGSFELVRTLFGLDATWPHLVSDSTFSLPSLTIPENLPEPFSEGYFKRCLQLFLQIIREKKGRALFLMSSKKSLEATYSALLPECKKNGVALLGVGPSGGLGKSMSLFLRDPEHSILLTTNQILPKLQEVEDYLDIVVFQKIPFDIPVDPLIVARSKFFDSGFENYTLPRAVAKFRELLVEFSESPTPKTCYLLDRRVKSREYGKLFLSHA